MKSSMFPLSSENLSCFLKMQCVINIFASLSMAVHAQIDLAQSLPGNDVTEGYFYGMEEPTSLIHSVDLQISMIINFSSVEVNRNQSPQRHPRVVRLVCQNKVGHIPGESEY